MPSLFNHIKSEWRGRLRAGPVFFILYISILPVSVPPAYAIPTDDTIPLLTHSVVSAEEAKTTVSENTEKPIDYRKEWTEPIFGPEFTFIKWNPESQQFEELESDKAARQGQYINHLHTHLIDNQSPAEKFKKRTTGPIIFKSPDGWDFSVTSDPGVIEIKMSPKTAQVFEKHASDIQDAIFVSAHNVNLYPALFAGGGHISLGKTIFDNDALLFRNFLVDFFNHAELSMGILGYDTNNALALNMIPAERIAKIKNGIREFDNEFQPEYAKQSDQLERLRKLLIDCFDDTTFKDAYRWKNPTSSRAAKYHAFNIGNLYNNRLEIRSVRPQASFDVFVRQIRLLRNRLKYLKRIDQPIPFKSELRVQLGRPGYDDNFTPPVEPQEALRAFYKYVRESGEKWQDHRDYLWPAWIYPIQPVESELSKFERSRWFKKQELMWAKRNQKPSCLNNLNCACALTN